MFCFQVNYKEPTPPGQDLIVRSQVIKIKESANVGSGKAAVKVDLSLHMVMFFPSLDYMLHNT
jgi:hypothetical protein